MKNYLELKKISKTSALLKILEKLDKSNFIAYYEILMNSSNFEEGRTWCRKERNYTLDTNQNNETALLHI